MDLTFTPYPMDYFMCVCMALWLYIIEFTYARKAMDGDTQATNNTTSSMVTNFIALITWLVKFYKAN